nr:RNA helicase, ATP-dependent, SK12/DOB1 protein [Tanacetum cinerariifolium]
MDILTRCFVSKDELSKKTIKIVPLKEHVEPVVSVPTSQLIVYREYGRRIVDLSHPDDMITSLQPDKIATILKAANLLVLLLVVELLQLLLPQNKKRGSKDHLSANHQLAVKGLSECKASESNVRRIQVKDIVKEVEDHLKTYSRPMILSAGYISSLVNLILYLDLLVQRDEESVSLKDEGTTKIEAFIAIAEDEPSVGKPDARSGQWIDITMKKNEVIGVNLKNESLKDEISAFGGKSQRKQNNPFKEVLFTKADVSISKSTPMITSDLEDDSDIQEPLPSLSKLTEADPSIASKSLISLSDLTAYMANLTLNTASKEIKKSNKVSHTYVIKKKTESKHPAVQNSCPDKSALPSTEQLLLTLMEETPKQKVRYGPCKRCGMRNNLSDDCYLKPKCSTCRLISHTTNEHTTQTVVKISLNKLKGQSTSKSTPVRTTRMSKTFAGSESRPPMLNKENYIPWSSRLLRYVKSRPNGKLIHNSILNSPSVRKMIPEPGDANRNINITETFHLQTDDELSDKELKQIEADDQAIQTILLGLLEDIYAAEKKAKLFNEWERFTSSEGESIESYYHRFLKLMNDLKRNKHFPEKIASNLKFLNNLQPEWSRHVTIVHQTKDLHTADYTKLYDFLKYNQKEIEADDQAIQTILLGLPEDIYAAVDSYETAQEIWLRPEWSRHVTIVHQTKDLHTADYTQLYDFLKYNQKENQIRNSNLVAARAEGNATGQNGNQIMCYNCRGIGIQLQAEEYDLMAAAVDLDDIEEVNANCILMANLQQASTSGTQSDSTPVYDTDGSTENDNDVVSEVTGVELGGEIVEQHLANFEETRALYDSLYQNLATKVEKVNSVNRKLKETNAELTTELA